MKKLLLSRLFALVAVTWSIQALAYPAYYYELTNHVSEQLLTYRCAACHVANWEPARNNFGQDFSDIFIRPNWIRFPTAEKMNSDEKWNFLLFDLDSNGNSLSNHDDFIQGRSPGLPVQ